MPQGFVAGTRFATSAGMKQFSIFSIVAALLLAGCNAQNVPNAGTSGDASTQKPDVGADIPAEKRAFVRNVHVVPGAGEVALKVDDKLAVPAADFGNASPFVAVEEGKKQIVAIGAGNTKVAGPMPVTLDAGEDLSVIVSGVPGDVALLPFKHKNGGPVAGKAKVAFLHAAKNLPAVDVFINGKRYRGGVNYGVATDYRELGPGRHTMQIRYVESLPVVKVTPIPTPTMAPVQGDPLAEIPPPSTPAPIVVKPRRSVTLTQQLDLQAGKVYSVIVFYDAQKLPKLRLLEDFFAAELKQVPKTE
jgi:hypothetical protein